MIAWRAIPRQMTLPERSVPVASALTPRHMVALCTSCLACVDLKQVSLASSWYGHFWFHALLTFHMGEYAQLIMVQGGDAQLRFVHMDHPGYVTGSMDPLGGMMFPSFVRSEHPVYSFSRST